MNKFILSLLTFILIFCQTNCVFAESNINTPEPEQTIQTTLPYNYQDTEYIPIHLSITKEISTRENHIEGKILEFRVLKDVIYNNQTILQKGDIVKAKLETIITSGMNGFPAEIIVDNFQIPDVKQSQLLSAYTKKGQNRCLWVYPLKWSLTLIPFVGSLTNLIMGGEAIIKTTDIITIYYFPNWK